MENDTWCCTGSRNSRTEANEGYFGGELTR
jgi:hypothetical protein